MDIWSQEGMDKLLGKESKRTHILSKIEIETLLSGITDSYFNIEETNEVGLLPDKFHNLNQKQCDCLIDQLIQLKCTLKGDKGMETNETFYMVVNDKNNSYPTKKHKEYKEAHDEAIRLLTKQPADVFYILEAVDILYSKHEYVTEPLQRNKKEIVKNEI